MSGLIQVFVARATLSGFRRLGHGIEGGEIDPFEAKLVADACKNPLAPQIEHLDRRAAIPYQPVGMAQLAMSAWPPAISNDPGGAGGRGMARRGIFSSSGSPPR